MKIYARAGSRRFVLIVNNKVIKIPKLSSWVSFIKGVTENLEERYWWSADGSRKRWPNRKWEHDFLAQIYWADRFGLILIAKRLDTDLRPVCFEQDLEELKMRCKGFKFVEDAKPDNVGYDNGKLKFIDYGWHGGSADCYLGT